ncbi:hypothetical protein BDV97DRAFT_196489 [Delphinella strobiligena]|nr:hypothetical protein BDV97DRAFT_196489 [Delphinella strobiligena]
MSGQLVPAIDSEIMALPHYITPKTTTLFTLAALTSILTVSFPGICMDLPWCSGKTAMRMEEKSRVEEGLRQSGGYIHTAEKRGEERKREKSVVFVEWASKNEQETITMNRNDGMDLNNELALTGRGVMDLSFRELKYISMSKSLSPHSFLI